MTKRTSNRGQPRLFDDASYVTVAVPAPMLEAVDAVAADHFEKRAAAVRIILERGLAAMGRPLVRSAPEGRR